MYETDILIIGAGVIGLAIARSLGDLYKNVIVIERNEKFGQETSSRNSEVIHAGIYYPPGSLKAKMCVRGRMLLYAFCEENNVPHKKIGKLIVATEKEEIAPLEHLFRNGNENGVPGLKILNREEIKKIEPNVFGIAALYSPETGIIDSHILMQRMIDKAKDNDVTIAFNSEVSAIERIKDGYKASVKDDGDTSSVRARIVVNCAGLESDTVAEMAGIDVKKNNYELHYCKGQYFRSRGKNDHFVKRLIYPIPKPKMNGLGIHATIDLAGSLRFGPDHEYLNDRVKDYSVNESRRKDFHHSVRKFLPFVEESDILPDTAGIRPKLQSANGDFRDFIISEESGKGLPGFINLVGIESPGLTASLAIAGHIREIVKNLN